MPATEAPDDRRRYERIPARIEVRFDDSTDAARALRAYSLNFSVGGLCIRSRHPYQVGSDLQMSMTIGDQDFHFRCTVAWVRGDAVGLRFEDVTESDRDRLETLVAALRK